MVKIAIVFEAHGDDAAVGLGGTIIKLVKEGYYIIDVVFSAGQKSLPHFREEVVIKKRINETEGIWKQFGIKQNIFFGLEDNNLKKEFEDKNIYDRVRRIIKKYKPIKIFSTSETDPHKDHRAAYHLVNNVIKDLNYKCEYYNYEVWNVVNEAKPVVYSDIRNYFKAKMNLMKSFRSQWMFMYALLLPVYFRAKIDGIKSNCKYAEKLYRIR